MSAATLSAGAMDLARRLAERGTMRLSARTVAISDELRQLREAGVLVEEGIGKTRTVSLKAGRAAAILQGS